MEKFLFLVLMLMLMLISRLFHAGSHTIIIMLMLMLVLIAQVGTRLKRLIVFAFFLGDDKNYHPAPWISGHLKESEPSYIWYWMREGPYQIPRSCMEVNFRGLLTNPVSGL